MQVCEDDGGAPLNPPLHTRQLVYYIARRIGLDPDVNLSNDQAEEILSACDDRLREAWESYDWVELTYNEQRAFRDDFDPELCYEVGDIVWDPCSRSYYKALVRLSGGPLEDNPKAWQSLPKATPAYIAWFQTGKVPIGTAFKAYSLNPFEDTRAVEVPFVISQRGLEFAVNSTPATVWLQYRIPYPGLGMFDWEPTKVYCLAQPVLFGEDTYHSLVDNNLALQPDLHPEVWRLFPLPYVLGRFVQQAAFSDTLITNGQNEKAQLEESKAYAYLGAEYDKQGLQQEQIQRFSVYVGN